MSIDYRNLDYLCFSSILHVLSLLTDIFLSPSIVALKINEIHLFTCSEPVEIVVSCNNKNLVHYL